MTGGSRGPVLLEHTLARLFRRYAAEFARLIAESLCFQGFEAELAGLPGRYRPPGGVLLLAMDDSLPTRLRGVAWSGPGHV